MAKTPDRQLPDFAHPPLASRDQLNEFLDGVARVRKETEHEDEEKQRQAIRAYLQKFDRLELQKLMGRAYADALKSPSQKRGTTQPPWTGTSPPKRPTRAGQRKKSRASVEKRSRARRAR
jgi:hypothetical protein